MPLILSTLKANYYFVTADHYTCLLQQLIKTICSKPTGKSSLRNWYKHETQVDILVSSGHSEALDVKYI